MPCTTEADAPPAAAGSAGPGEVTMTLHLEAGVEPVPGYRLVRVLGKGGFGEVWEATAPGGVRVALKFIRLDGDAADPELRALEVIRDIRHPHLLDVQFAAQVGDCLVIAMPLCDQSLADRLRDCRGRGLPGLPLDELRQFMGELAEAVDFLNEPVHPGPDGVPVGIQHRDIKPHNVFLVGGSARLADFGLAKVLEGASGSHTGAMTPGYVAPEVLSGRISRRSDQYSLAATYVQLRTGRLPFAGTHSEVLHGHLHGEPDLAGLPGGERAAVARALAKDPEARWPSCRDFVRALGEPDPGHHATEPVTTARRDYRTVPASGPTAVGPATRPDARGTTDAWISAGTAATDPQTGPPRRGPRGGVLIGLGVLACLVAAGVALRPGPRVGTPAGPSAAKEVAVRGSAAKIDPPVAGGGTERPDVAPKAPVARPTRPVRPPVAEPIALAPPRAAEAGHGLAKQALATLRKYCYRCHGVRFEVPGYDVLDRDKLVAKRGEGEQPYVVPGKPDESELWNRVGVEEDMPPSGAKPSAGDRELIKDWIAAGAPFPLVDAAARPALAERDVLAAIRGHLDKARPEDRPFLRYFSLANLHNNRAVREDELRLARAAVAKLMNSLSWKVDLVVPAAVDPEATVLTIDLRDLGWDQRGLWKEILAAYPYGLKHDKDPAEADRALAADVYERSGTSQPFVRADWFVATASRPPLYHTLLDLPKHAQDLERSLKVDPEADFLNDKLARAGFAKSGISSQNRLVDRHPADYGAYWKSYDFRRSEGTGNLFRFPLGPVFDANPFPNQAFEHAGGEVIFNLPNGLQGYLLVDAKGGRIDAGPTDIVGDDDKTAGTSAVVNGLSCMACHRTGMQPFKDTIRGGLAVAGGARAKAERLFPAREAMDKLLAKDEARFLAAVDQAAGAFLKVGDDASKAIRDFPEPIGAVARGYLKDLDAGDVAAEFGLKDPRELPALIRANPRLRQLGLGPLTEDGGTIKRSEWDSLDGRFLSTFHEAARELELGTPFRAF